jgi:AcrR family transcriptional regulator
MSRTANAKRPEELRNAIVQYLIKHGLADLSLRPLAKAVGSSPRGLLYYFGSKEQMIVQILAQIRQRQLGTYGEVRSASFSQECWVVWKQMSASDSEPLFRLFFEAYGIALRHPRLYKNFLRSTIEDWLQLMTDQLSQQGHTRGEARAFATVVLAGMRGFMLDYCNTHDRKRLDRAVALWLRSLDSMLSNRQEAT